MLTYADLLLEKDIQKHLLTNINREALNFLLNVIQNSLHLKYSPSTKRVLDRYQRDLTKLINKQTSLAKKKLILKKRGAKFIPLLIKPYINSFRKLL